MIFLSTNDKHRVVKRKGSRKGGEKVVEVIVRDRALRFVSQMSKLVASVPCLA
jgi:hypothetical protein